MSDNIYIIIENNNAEMSSLISQLEPYSINSVETHSCAGIETVTLIMDGIQVIAALLAIPILAQSIEQKKVVVKFMGITIGYSIDEIVEAIKNTPDFLEKLKMAIDDKSIEIEGKAKTAANLWNKLNQLINTGEEKKDE